MGLLLAFAPFIAFFALVRLISPFAGLIAALVVSLVLCGRMMLRREAVKTLEIGTLVLFAALVLWTIVIGTEWSIARVRLAVDAGLLAIVVISLLVGRPFTLQYARERVPEPLWNTPQFLATSRIVALVWAGAFAVLVAADAAAEYVPEIPVRADVWASVAALVGAFWFTGWYPDQVRRRNNAGSV